MASKRDAIDAAKQALATARKAVAVDDARIVKAVDGIAKRIHTAYLVGCKLAKVDPDSMTFVTSKEGTVRRGGGTGGDKSLSLGRQAKVTGWIVGGKSIGSPMASKLIAAIYNVERGKDIYDKDSPERFIRKPAFLDRIKGRKVKVVRDGKTADAIAFLSA